MSEKNVTENFGNAMIDLLQTALSGTFAKMEKRQDEFEDKMAVVLESLKEIVFSLDNDVSTLDQSQKNIFSHVERNIKMATNDIKYLRVQNEELKQTINVMHDDFAKTLKSLVQSVEQIKQENASLKQLEKNLSDHKQDDTRHIKRINGATEKNLARAKEVNNQRSEETNIKIFRAIFGYLQNAQDKNRVDMTWLIQTTGLSESSIRQAVKEVQEHKLDNHIEKQEDGSFLFYGLLVPIEFLRWYKKGNFFNVPR